MDPNVLQRIERLEQSNRRMRVALGVLLITLAALVVVGGTKPGDEVPRRVVAKSLDIVNDRGDIVVHMGVRTNGAGGLWITDADGRRVLKLNQSQDGSGRVTVLTSEGEEAGALAVDEHDRIHLETP